MRESERDRGFCVVDRSLRDAQREFRLQLANAVLDTAVRYADTEFGAVTHKVDRFLRLRDRRLASARAANRRYLIRREFGNLLDSV